jgi:hypothetical protein
METIKIAIITFIFGLAFCLPFILSEITGIPLINGM